MRPWSRWALFCGWAVCTALGCDGPAAGDSASLPPGLWTGGAGRLDGDRPDWNILQLDIPEGGPKVRGQRIDILGRGETLSVETKGDTVRLESKLNGKTLHCEARVEGERRLTGLCENAGRELTLDLLRIEPIPPGRLDGWTGIWERADGGRLFLRPGSNGLSMLELPEGTRRTLYSVSPTRFVAGPRIAVPHPHEATYDFSSDDSLRITDAQGNSVMAKRTEAFRTEPMSIEVEGATLQGTLTLPHAKPPHPAILWVHGSGRANRSGAGWWPLFFADHGYAVLAVDKRGVGESSGTYELPDGGHDNYPHMRRRSRDVLTTLRALAAREDIRSDRVGLVGGSQAGWVIPMASDTGEVAFTITLSGGATPVDVEGRFSDWAGEMDATSDSIDALIERLRKYKPTGHDFTEDFAAQTAPGLWLYGGLDRSNPSLLCVEMIEGLRKTAGKDFTTRFFPSGNHGLMDARIGGMAEYGALQRQVPGLYEAIVEWMSAHGLLAPTEAEAEQKKT